MKKLLQLLEDDCTLTHAQLASMTGLTEAEVAAAIAAYEQENIILGYKAIVDWDRTDREAVTAQGGGAVRGPKAGPAGGRHRHLHPLHPQKIQRKAPDLPEAGAAGREVCIRMIDYSKILCRRIQDVPPSGIRKYFDLLNGMDGAISLGIGEPDFPTPWHIRDAGIYSLEKGFTKYTPNAGLSDLRQAISAYLKRRFDLDYAPIGQILVTVGGSEGLDLAFRCLLNPGDEVIIPTPSFVCYGPLVSMCHGVPVLVETHAENDFRLTPEALRAAITPHTKAVVLPFPNNPTGGIMGRADLEALADVLRDTDIMVVSDEIYAELTYGQHHVSMANLPDMYERTLVINGFSKAYSG